MAVITLTTGTVYCGACGVFIFFLMISRRQIISGSTGPIFAIFSPNESVLGADDRSGHLFPISQGTLLWQAILCKVWCTRRVGNRLDNIGLRKFTTPSLFLELLGPVSFLMVIIIQLHYFHTDFLRISSLDRFVKCAATTQ